MNDITFLCLPPHDAQIGFSIEHDRSTERVVSSESPRSFGSATHLPIAFLMRRTAVLDEFWDSLSMIGSHATLGMPEHM
jgi:hypothetical protein